MNQRRTWSGDSRTVFLGAGFWLLVAGCATTPSAPPLARLHAVADSVMTTPPLHRTHWGIQVRDATRGRTLLSVNEDRHFIPASNNKLLVSAVALAELGAEYRWHTDFRLLPAGGGGADTLPSLLVVGRGDPTISGRFHGTDREAVDALADSIISAWTAAPRAIGAVVVDASHFDDRLRHGTWEIDDLVWYYAAPVAAFGVAEGAVALHVASGIAHGAPAVVEAVDPSGPVVVRNLLRTDSMATARRWRVERIAGTDTVVVEGILPTGVSGDTAWISVSHPAVHGGVALARALAGRGLPVLGEVRVVHDTTEARILAARAAAIPIHTRRSPPLVDVVAGLLKPSQNWIAESVVKTLGAERGDGGSWSGGIDVLERYLAEVAGIDPDAFFLRDASGLSAQNLVTPAALVELLDHARERPWGADFRRALAMPGEEGTLSGRLQGLAGRLEAKTGTITNVNSLSGYLLTDDGRELTFSILSNGSGRPASEVRAAIDRIVAAAAAGGAP